MRDATGIGKATAMGELSGDACMDIYDVVKRRFTTEVALAPPGPLFLSNKK